MGTLDELAALLKSADLLITVNTFTMHLGVALNVKMLAIVGATDPSVILPPHTPRVYSYRARDISLDSVKEKVRELLG
jgi:ADP-heptose:LPS heptosyltransferase